MILTYDLVSRISVYYLMEESEFGMLIPLGMAEWWRRIPF